MNDKEYDRCAMCKGIIPEYELSVTLSSGKRICEACIREAMCNKYGRRENIE